MLPIGVKRVGDGGDEPTHPLEQVLYLIFCSLAGSDEVV